MAQKLNFGGLLFQRGYIREREICFYSSNSFSKIRVDDFDQMSALVKLEDQLRPYVTQIPPFRSVKFVCFFPGNIFSVCKLHKFPNPHNHLMFFYSFLYTTSYLSYIVLTKLTWSHVNSSNLKLCYAI